MEPFSLREPKKLFVFCFGEQRTIPVILIGFSQNGVNNSSQGALCVFALSDIRDRFPQTYRINQQTVNRGTIT